METSSDQGEVLTLTVRRSCHPGQEVVTVESNLPLDKLRKQLQHQCDGYRFLANNTPISHNQESILMVRDVLPKLFHGFIPGSQFTFPGVDYTQVELYISGQSIKVMCALVLHLVPAWPDDFGESTVTFNSVYFKPPVSADCRALDKLFEGCATGSESQVSEVLNDWPESSVKEWFSSLSSSGQATPLHYAAENGHLDVCKLLLKQFPEIVGFCDSKGQTALDYALLWKRFEIVAELLSSLPRSNPEPPGLATLETYLDNDLVTLGTKINSTYLGNFPSLSKHLLHAAIVKHDVALAQKILENLPTDRSFLDGQDELGWTMLHHCVSNGNVDMIANLCETGVDKTVKDHHGLTPFLLACHQGKPEMLPHLVEQNPSNDIISQAIEEAAKYSHLKTVEEVLRLAPLGCILTQKAWDSIAVIANQDYQTCAGILALCPDMDEKGVMLNRFLLDAAKYGDTCTLMKLLSKAEVNVNFQDFLGHSALHEAVCAEKLSVVNTLCQHPDVDINIQNWRGESPLHYACKKGLTSVVIHFLKQTDISVNLQDQAGRTPVLTALYWGQGHILDLFLAEKAHHQSLFLPDNGGLSTLHYAPFLPAPSLDRLLDIPCNSLSFPESTPTPETTNSEGLTAIFSSVVEENKPEPVENIMKLPKRLRHLCSQDHKEFCPLCNHAFCATGRCYNKRYLHVCQSYTPERKRRGKKPPFSFHKGNMIPPAMSEHPLHVAVKLNRQDLLAKLARTATDLKALDPQGRTPIDLSVDLLRPDCVEELLKVHSQLEPDLFDQGLTSLVNRCLSTSTLGENDSGHRIHVLRTLLKYIPNTGLPDVLPTEEISPLVKACSLGFIDCVDLLLQNESFSDYVPAILTAVQAGHTAVLSRLFHKLDQHQDGKSLFEKLSHIRDHFGRNLLGVALHVKGEQALNIVKTIVSHCPSLLEFPLFNEIKIKNRSFMCSNTTGVTVLKNCRGNTILECIMDKKYNNSTEKGLWEEVGCFLIEHGADEEIVEVGDGNVIHARCAALHAAVRHGFWRLATKLIDRGASEQAWLCTNDPQHSSCQKMLGLMMDDVVYHLCHPKAPENLLVQVLQMGLDLQKKGAIQTAVNPGNLEQLRLLWIAQSCHASYVFEEDHLKEFDILVKIPMVSKPQKPLDMVIVQAMQPLIGWKKKVQKRPHSVAKLLLKAPGKRKRKKKGSHKSVSREHSPQVQSVTTPNQVITLTPRAASSPLTISCTPCMIFTPSPQHQGFMGPRSARLAKSRKHGSHKREATPSVFYLGEGTPSPGFSPGLVSPLVSPSAAFHHCIYISSVSQEASHLPETPTDGVPPVFIPDYIPQTPNKLNKFYIRTQFKCRMMQSVAAILQIQPSLTRRVVACLKMADVDFVSNLVPRSTLNSTQLVEKFLLDRTTMKLACEGSRHETSVFVEACYKGEKDVVKKIIQMVGAESLQKMDRSHVVRVGKKMMYPMKVSGVGAAACRGHTTIVNLLLENGLRPTWQDMQACITASPHIKEERFDTMLRLLIQSIQPSEGSEVFQRGTLVEAAKHGHYESISLMLNEYQQLHCPGYLREAFVAAAERGHTDVAGALLRQLQEVCKDISNTPNILPMASKSKAWPLVTEILQTINSPSPLLETDATKKTILHHAAIDGQCDIVKMCLERMLTFGVQGSPESFKSFLEQKDLRERSALWYACQQGNVDIAVALLSYGANSNGAIPMTDDTLKQLRPWFDTALIATARSVPVIQIACSKGLTDIVDVVLSLQPKLVEDDICMTHCLLSALMSGNLETYRFLCSKGVEVDDVSLVVALLMSFYYTSTDGKANLVKKILPNDTQEKQHLVTGYPEAIRFGMFVRWVISDTLVDALSEFAAYVTLGERCPIETTAGLEVLDQLLVSLPTTALNSLTSLRLAALASEIADPEVTEKLLQYIPDIVTPSHAISKSNPYRTPHLMEYSVTLSDMVLATQHKEEASESISAIFRAIPEHKLGNLAVLLTCQRHMQEILDNSVVTSSCHAVNAYEDTWAHVLCCLLLNTSGDLFLSALNNVVEAQFDGEMRNVSRHQIEAMLTVLLQLAVGWNKTDVIKPLIDLGANCFDRITENVLKELNLLETRWLHKCLTHKEFTAFHWASYMGFSECLNLLLSGVSPIESVSEEKVRRELGSELWVIGASRGHTTMLQWLAGQEPSSHTSNDYTEPARKLDFDNLLGMSLEPVTLLLTAARNGKLKTVHWLLDRLSDHALNKIRDDLVQKDLYQSLAMLCDEGAVIELIDKLLTLNIPGLSSVDTHGSTPLGYAQRFGNLRTQAYLLRRGASPAESEIFAKKWCVYHGALRHCLDEKTSVPEESGQPAAGPIGYDIILSKDKQVQVSGIPQRLYQRLVLGDDQLAHSMLVSIEPILRQRTMPVMIRKYLLSLVQMACRSGCPTSLKLLLDLLYDQWNECKTMLSKSLLWAVRRGHTECIKIFKVASFHELNMTTHQKTGESLLHLAVRTKNKDVIKTVVSFLGEPVPWTKPDFSGLTPVACAESLGGMTDILAELIQGYSPPPKMETDDLDRKPTLDPVMEAERLKVFQGTLKGISSNQDMSDWEVVNTVPDCIDNAQVKSEVDIAKERVNSRTIPALTSVIKDTLDKDNVNIEINWDSFFGNLTPETIEEGLQLSDIFHHSKAYGVQFAGLGPTLQQCSQFMYWIKCLGGEFDAKKEFMDFDTVRIQRGTPVRDTGVQSKTVVWNFDFQNGKVLYDQDSFPPWRILRQHYLAALTLSPSLCTADETSKEEENPSVKFDLDLRELMLIVPPQDIPQIITGPISEEVNRFSWSFRSSQHIRKQIQRVTLSFSEASSSHATVKAEAGDMYLNMQIFKKHVNGKEIWDAELPCLDETMAELDWKSLGDEGLLSQSDHIDQVEVEVDSIGKESAGPIDIKIDQSARDFVLRNSLQDMKSLEAILESCRNRLTNITKETLEAFVSSCIFDISSGLYAFPEKWVQTMKSLENRSENGFIQFRGKTLKVLDSELCSAIQNSLPKCVTFTHSEERKPFDEQRKNEEVVFDIPQGFCCMHPPLKMDITINTEWNKSNLCLNEKLDLIQTDKNNEQIQFEILNVLKHCRQALSLADDISYQQIKDAIVAVLDRLSYQSEKLRKIRWFHQKIEQVKAAAKYIELVNKRTGEQSTPNLFLPVLTKVFQKERPSASAVFSYTVGEITKDVVLFSSPDLEAPVCPVSCTVVTQCLNQTYFPFGETEEEGPAALQIELRDINGKRLANGKPASKVSVRLCVLQPVYSFVKIPTQHTVSEMSDGSILSITWQTKDAKQCLAKLEHRNESRYLDVQIDGCPIKSSPFPVFPEQGLSEPVSHDNQPIFRAPVSEAVQLVLLHNHCPKDKTTRLIAPRSKPSVYMANTRPWRQLRQEGWRQCWSLNTLRGFSDHPAHCQVEMSSPQVISLSVIPQKVGDLRLRAHCEACHERLQFVVPGALPCDKLHIKAVPGQLCRTLSSVVDPTFNRVLPKDAKWRLKAGENLNFLFKLSDSRGNPAYMPQVTPTPDFSFSSEGENEPVKVSFQCVDAEKGVLRLQTEDVCKPGTYHLKVDHHCTAYSLQVSPAKVDPAMCQLTGSGLRTTNPDNAQSVFKIQLKDKFGNVVNTSEILHSVLVTTTQPEVSVTKKMVDGVIVCSYCTPADFRGSFQLEVYFNYDHLKGSPFTVKWTSTKSFEQKHSELRKALSKLKRAKGSCTLLVRRDQVLEDSFAVFQRMDSALLHYPTEVQFFKEQGVDAGGLTREWYQLLSRAIFNPSYALFEQVDGNRYRPNQNSAIQEDHLTYFYFVGQIFGKAIFDGENLDVHLVSLVYKALLELGPDLSDLAQQDTTLHRSLELLANMSTAEEVEAMCLAFVIDESTFGSSRSIPLKPGGADIEVTLENRLEYISYYTQYVLCERIQSQMKQFKEGFASVIPLKLVSELTPPELELLMCGPNKVEVSSLRQLTTYTDGYTPTNKQVLWLWQLLGNWNQEKRKSFLQFVTGNTRLPACTRDWRLVITRVPDSDNLPTASTCFNHLVLPAYKKRAKLVEKVTKAISLGAQGFGKM